MRNWSARHRGELPRLDHSDRYDAPDGTDIGDGTVNLARDATNIVCRDLIGNVITLGLHRAIRGKCDM